LRTLSTTQMVLASNHSALSGPSHRTLFRSIDEDDVWDEDDDYIQMLHEEVRIPIIIG
jgi:hypothetical protein